MTEQEQRDDWIPIPHPVAIILGRITFYTAWLDDTVGEVITAASLHLSDDSATTPGWASSGKQLVAALRRLDVGEPRVSIAASKLADRLESVNAVRNQLVHGVWQWGDDSVMVTKRSLDPGQRSIDYARYTYSELLAFVVEIQSLGRLAESFERMLRQGNPVLALAERAVTPECPTDGVPLAGAFVEDILVWRCEICGLTQSAAPTK